MSTFVLDDRRVESVPPMEQERSRARDAVARYQDEIDTYFGILQRLNSMDPVQVFQQLSSICARVSEMRTRLMRSETRRETSFRTREIDPLLEELDRQFRIHSRIQAVREMDLRLTAGQI